MTIDLLRKKRTNSEIGLVAWTRPAIRIEVKMFIQAKSWRVLPLPPVLAVLAWAMPTLGGASTLAPTQLKGLDAVNISVQVSIEGRSDAASVENALKARVEEALAKSKVGVVARGEEWLEIKITGRPIESAKPSMFALAVSVRLREHVSLRRDHSLDVPGGGALTWWREGLWLSSQEQLQKTLEEAVLDYVDVFTDQLKSVNRGNGAALEDKKK
ncbi:MAG: hypothetical protein ABI682_03165 [Acidobacteriota bacterium]